MKSTAAILIALCLAYLQNVNADVKVHRKSIVTTDKQLGFWIESYTDEHLTYALCDKKHPSEDEIKCTVIREKKPYGDDTYSCDVTLKRPHRPHDPKRLPHIYVYPFGQKYAALTVLEGDEGYTNFTVVQMDNCKVSEAAVYYKSSTGWFSVAVVGHGDSFDVFFKDVTAVSCGEKMCKVTIGADGRLVNELKPSIRKLVHSDYVPRSIVAIDNGPSGNGYFYITEDGNDYLNVLVKADGTEKTLARCPKPTGMVAMSTKNNLLGVCYQMDDKLECSQYDFDGNSKHKTTITSDDKDNFYVDIYNLSGGGFYVSSAGCEKRPSGSCGDINQFFIERYEANGTKTGRINFQGFDTKFQWKILSPLFYENDAKEVCFSLAATQSTEAEGGRSELAANCFTDADFSK